MKTIEEEEEEEEEEEVLLNEDKQSALSTWNGLVFNDPMVTFFRHSLKVF